MFEYELDGEVLQFTQEDVDNRAKEKGLTTEDYLTQHPEVKPVEVEKTEDVAEPGVAVASETTAPDVSASSSEDTSSDLPAASDQEETAIKAKSLGFDVVPGARQEGDTIYGVMLPEAQASPLTADEQFKLKETQLNVDIENFTEQESKARQSLDDFKAQNFDNNIELNALSNQAEEIIRTVGLDRFKKGLAAKPVYDEYNKIISKQKELLGPLSKEYGGMVDAYNEIAKQGLPLNDRLEEYNAEVAEKNKNKSPEDIKAEQALREGKKELYALTRGVPSYLAPYFAGIDAFAATTIGGLIELVDNYGYKPAIAAIKSLDPEKSFEESLRETISEGYDIDTDLFYEFAEEMNSLQSKFYNDEGKEIGATDLLLEGRVLDAAAVISEQAVASAPSFALSVGMPVAGSAILGLSVAGTETKENLEKRASEGLGKVYANGFAKGGSEFITEFLGGKIARGISKARGRGVAEEVVRELPKNVYLSALGKAGLGFLGEGTTEAATERLNILADSRIYNDEITLTQILKQTTDAFLIGGFLGGPIAGTSRALNRVQKGQVYEMMAPVEWQLENNKYELQKAQIKNDLDKAPDAAKPYMQEKLDEVTKKQQEAKDKIFKAFDSMSQGELEAYAKEFDSINKKASVVSSNKVSKEARTQAEQDINQAYANMEGLIGESINTAFEKQVVMAKESIKKGKDFRKGVKGLLGALKNKGAKIQMNFGSQEEFKAHLREQQLDQEAEVIAIIQGMNEIIADETADQETRQEAIDIKEFYTQYQRNQLNAIEGAASRYGSATPNADGSFSIFVNDDAEIRDGVFTTDAHELGHAIVYLVSKGNPELAAQLGKELKTEIDARAEDLEGTVFQRRYESYTKEEGQEFEIFSLAVESISDGDLQFNKGLLEGINDGFRRWFKSVTGKAYSFDSGKDVFNFLKDYQKSIEKGVVNKGLVNTIVDGASGKLTEGYAKAIAIDPDEREQEEQGQTTFSKEISPKAQQYLELEIDNESLVDIINSRSSSAEEVFGGIDALIEKNWPVISNAIKFNPTGEISMDAVKEAVAEQMQGVFPEVKLESGRKINRKGRLLDTYNKTRKVTTFLTATLGPRTAEILARGKQIDANTRAASLDKAAGIQDDSAQPFAEESSTYQETKPKINILKDFAGVQEDKIVSISKPVEGDTFKQIIEKYAGRSGQEVFGIPAKKIMEGGANLVPTTKIKEGMAAPSEALQIQRFFGAAQNLENFVKTLPLYNVTEMTADINRQGENIEVSRDTYGVAIGLKGLPLDYFYEGFVDPTGVMTSPKGRSKGLTSQTPVKKLKQKFRKPTKEVLDQLKKDLGITPAKQRNEYTRDIGQLLKGLAKVYSINASLSGAQRNQEAKLEEAKKRGAKPEEIKAIKQQTADITAAQSKTAFSKAVEDILDGVNIRYEFNPSEMETKYIDNLLDFHKAGKTLDIRKLILTEDGRVELVNEIKTKLLPLMPKSFWFPTDKGTAFTASNSNYGVSMSTNADGSYKDPKGAEAYNDFRNKIQKLRNLPDTAFGKEIKGVDAYNVSKYSSIFKDAATIEKNIKNGKIAEWNKSVTTIHKAMWQRLNKAVSKDRSLAPIVGTYLKLVANDKNHFHRLGAEFVGYSPKLTKTKKGKLKYEYEHAMPATAAYIYLMDAILGDADFASAYELVSNNYKLIALDKAQDEKLASARTALGGRLQVQMPDGWSVVTNDWFERYFNSIVAQQNGGIDPASIKGLDGRTFDKIYNVNVEGNTMFSKPVGNKPVMSEAISNARPVMQYSKKATGMSTFDFDETLIIDGENFIVATKGDDVQRISSGNWPLQGPKFAADGYEFDFTDFVNVRGGVDGPLLQKMKNQIKKYGTKNVFVLTARPQESATAIHEWLKTKGINIPFENITGLGNSTGDAKAAWFLDKYAEGYNDMYFVDDALPNVEAVQHVFNQLDIKGKSVQAKIQFSKGLSTEFNKMLERTKGVSAEKIFSRVVGQKRGKNIGRYRFFVPPSADDFAGLLYDFYGKGKQGEADMEFMKKALLDPFARADAEMSQARMSILDDYKTLRKELPNVKKKLGKIIDKNTGFTFDNAVRVYLFDKAGFEVPGISKRDLAYLKNQINTDQDLKTFADTLSLISKRKEGWIEPGEYWSVETIASDLENIVNKIGRKKYLAEFIENKDIIFSPENMNKIEAVYGSRFRSALEDSLYRMVNGTNRSFGRSYGQSWTNWVNGSVGAIMFFNARSAVLQTLSTVNFINFQDNNIFKAGKAFANQKQYWKDFSTLFNSDFLKARRAGLQINVNEAELANAVAGAQNKAKAALAYLLKKGFLPTQIADSFAIASGGATFYRNRVKTYTKQGLDQKSAEEKAFLDFQEIAQETQQSSRPDRISQQQASPLGRLILAFANTPMQYNRLIKKAGRDLINNRGDWRSNVSRILYYGAIQNVIFSSLQQAIFALSFDDEEDDAIDKRTQRVLNGTIDTILRGSGLTGAAIATIKNTILRFIEESERGSRADYGQVAVEATQVSPPMGSKMRKLYSALNSYKFNREIMGSMDTFDYNNPTWDAYGKVVSAATNVPLDRLFRKTDNIREALNQENTAMQRAFLALGWSAWDLQVGERVVMNKGKKNQYVKYLDLKRQAQQEAKDELKQEKKEEKKKSQQRCTKIKSDGFRCKIMVDKPKKRCHYHN